MFAKKSLGQNFLMHRQTGERIVLAANLPEDATVLEIGPGTGMLTRELLKRVGRVVAVEADGTLVNRAVVSKWGLRLGRVELRMAPGAKPGT